MKVPCSIPFVTNCTNLSFTTGVETWSGLFEASTLAGTCLASSTTFLVLLGFCSFFLDFVEYKRELAG